MSNVISLFKKESDVCIDSLVESWHDAISIKLSEIDDKYGREAAYQFYSRISFKDIEKSRLIVDHYIDEKQF